MDPFGIDKESVGTTSDLDIYFVGSKAVVLLLLTFCLFLLPL